MTSPTPQGARHSSTHQEREVKKKLQTTQRRMMRMIIQTKRQAGTSYAAAQAASASVDVTADAKPHDPYSEQGNDRTEHNDQDSNDPKRAPRPQQAQPLLRRNPRRQSRKRARTVGRVHTESNTQSGRLANIKQNHVVDSQAEPDLLEAGKDDCQAPRRPLDHARLQLEPSNINLAKGLPQTKEDQPRDGRTTSTLTSNQTKPTETTTTSRAT